MATQKHAHDGARVAQAPRASATPASSHPVNNAVAARSQVAVGKAGRDNIHRMGHEMMASGAEDEKQLRWDAEWAQESMPSSSTAGVRGSSREGKHQQHLHQMDAVEVRQQTTGATNAANTPSASTRSNSTASSSAAWTHSQAVSPSSSHSGVETVSEEHRSFKAVGATPSSFSSAILSASPLSPSTDPHSQLLVNALTAEATRQGASSSHQRHQRSSEDRRAQAHAAGGPSEESRLSSGRESRQDEHGKGTSGSGGLSPFGAYKLVPVAGTANETAEPTWSRPSSGPASAYSSPHARTSPLPTNAATYAKMSLSHAAAAGEAAVAAGGLTTPSAYHRAMSTSAAEALDQSHRSVSHSSSLAQAGAHSPVPVTTPSATGSLTPDPSSGHATNHKMTPSGSGRSTPSQMSHGDTLSGKPHVLETHRLQLQTHKPSGRRMINQYIIEDELGRGVHGKVRMAWDTETGERVAVKIVERQSRKRLGGSTDWSARIAAKRKAQVSPSAAPHSPEASESAYGKGKGKASDSQHDAPNAVDTDSTEPKASSGGGGMHAHFAPSPPRSPGARFGRWGQSLPNRDDHEEAGSKKEDKMKKSLLWTTDKKVKREIAIMKKCAHENVVRLREVIDDPQSKKIFMVLEYMAGGEIQWKDEFGRPRMTVEEARRTIRDVVLGLEYLHYQGIIHRDIKPANLLWDEEKRVKISDFGVSHYSYALLVASGGLSSSSPGETRDPSLMDDRELAKTAGSPAFFAPELCLAGDPALTAGSTTGSQNRNSAGTGSPSGNSTHSHFPFDKEATSAPRPPRITKAIDIWALGVTLFCLLFGELPFTAPSEFALFNIIPTEDYNLPIYMGSDKIRVGPRKPRWKGLPEWEDEEPDVHPTDPREIVPDVDPSMLSQDARQLRDLLDRLLEKDPEKRIKLEEVKKHPWVTRGLRDTPAWLTATAPEQHPFVEVTHEEVEDALTGFSKIKQRVKRWQSKLLDTLGARGTRSRSHSQTSSTKPYVGTPGDRLTPGTDDFGSVRSAGAKSPRVPWFGKRSVPTTPGGSSVSPSLTIHRSAAFGMTPNLTNAGEVHSKAVPHHEVDALLQRIISDRSANSPSVTLPTASTRSTSSERRSLFERRVSKELSPPAASARTSSLVRPVPARSSSESVAARNALLEGSAPVTRNVSNISSARQSFDGARPSGIPSVERRASRNRLGDLFHFGRSKGGSVSRQNSKRGANRNAENTLQLDVAGAVSQVGSGHPANTPASAPILSMQNGLHARSSIDGLHSLPASEHNFFASQPGSPSLVVTSLNDDEHDVDLELDLSDDDLGDEQHDTVLRNSGNGWRMERFSNTSTDGGASLTPSVEGGYNLFKPEYTGKVAHEHFAIGQPREAVEKELSPSPQYGYGYYDSGALDKVSVPLAAVLPASGSGAETMIIHSPSGATEDSSRFADADESSSGSGLAAEMEMAAARGRFEGQEMEDEEEEEEDDGCVSFRAGRSSRSTTISRQLSRVTSRDGTRQ